MTRRDYLRERFADNPQALELLDRRHRDVEAELVAMPAIDAETLAAVEHLRSEEAVLNLLLRNGDLSAHAYGEIWLELMQQTPHHVQMADLKIIKTMNQSLTAPASVSPEA